jgi:dihydrofolate synthase/folylpolyglutamate synthase
MKHIDWLESGVYLLLKSITMKSNYELTLEYMFEQLPMFTRIGDAAYKADLNNTLVLSEALGNPHLKFKTIHIAGTNGKGSCSNMLAAIFQTAGYKTGLYTSPHIVDFRERIRINGTEIDEQSVIDFIAKHKQLIEEIQPSFFEITVVMAFDYFATQGVDIAVVEVGLGGALDSTNIIVPELSIITNISYDHMSLLGQNLPQIAEQKAGIIKDHVPVVIGESQLELQNIFFAKAIKHKSQLFCADAIYETLDGQIEDGKLHLKLLNKSLMLSHDIILDLIGNYQYKNCKTVLTAIDVLRKKGWNITEHHIMTSLSQVKKITGFKGRFDIVKYEPLVVFDGSHNEAGLTEVFNQVKSMKYNSLFIILGVARDKELSKVLKIFPTDAYYFFTQADIPRALPYIELQAIGLDAKLDGEGCPTMKDALESAFKLASPNDLILVTGSFYTLKDAYDYLKQTN